VNARNLDYQELVQLIELVKSSSHFTEFKFRSGDLEIELRRGPPGAAAGSGDLPAPAPSAPAVPAPVAVPVTAPTRHPEATVPTESVRKARPEGSVVVKSPMVGTFYRSSEPGVPAFVEIGRKVEPNSTLCIIEVMKLMNTINADCHGVVTEILVADGEALEFGQELFVIAPN
jgi:acetyl-CoA carboxylase biotin carboxyl carrier protein